jgi:hypothetical protein
MIRVLFLILQVTGEATDKDLVRMIWRKLCRLYSQVRYIEEAIGVSCNRVKRRTHTCPFVSFTMRCPSYEEKQ